MEAGAEQCLGTGTGLDTLRNELKHTLAADGHNTSALGESFEVTPIVVPIRGHFGLGDQYIGQGSRQRSLGKSLYCNTVKVSQYGHGAAWKLKGAESEIDISVPSADNLNFIALST